MKPAWNVRENSGDWTPVPNGKTPDTETAIMANQASHQPRADVRQRFAPAATMRAGAKTKYIAVNAGICGLPAKRDALYETKPNAPSAPVGTARYLGVGFHRNQLLRLVMPANGSAFSCKGQR